MAHRAQALNDRGVGVRLYLHLTSARPLPPGRVEALLRVHAVVHRVYDHLHMTLGLHEAAHHTEGPHCHPTTCQEGRDNRVVWTLVWFDSVGVGGVHAEAVPTVLQRYASIGHH